MSARTGEAGLTGVIVAAGVSVLLGGALALAVLVFTPVETVAAIPADARPGSVYVVSGSSDRARGGEWQRKQGEFLRGASVAVNEDELNLAAAKEARPATHLPGGKPPPALEAGALNFRIRDGVFQLATPLTINKAGLSETVMFQARGGFVRSGDAFVFAPDEVYLGACPLHRLPGAAGIAMQQMAAMTRELPAPVRDAWRRLADVSVEGEQLQLTAAQ